MISEIALATSEHRITDILNNILTSKKYYIYIYIYIYINTIFTSKNSYGN